MLLRRYAKTKPVKEESEDVTTSLTVKEIKALLAEKGIKYDAKAKKEELNKLLEGAE